MLLSEFSGKEIVNLYDGAKLGYIGDSDIKINSSGNIEAIVLTSRQTNGWFFSKNNETKIENIVIPWGAIKKVGSEVVIVDINYNDIGTKYCSV